MYNLDEIQSSRPFHGSGEAGCDTWSVHRILSEYFGFRSLSLNQSSILIFTRTSRQSLRIPDKVTLFEIPAVHWKENYIHMGLDFKWLILQITKEEFGRSVSANKVWRRLLDLRKRSNRAAKITVMIGTIRLTCIMLGQKFKFQLMMQEKRDYYWKRKR